jgi:hypothetical protein
VSRSDSAPVWNFERNFNIRSRNCLLPMVDLAHEDVAWIYPPNTSTSLTSDLPIATPRAPRQAATPIGPNPDVKSYVNIPVSIQALPLTNTRAGSLRRTMLTGCLIGYILLSGPHGRSSWCVSGSVYRIGRVAGRRRTGRPGCAAHLVQFVSR